MWDGRGVTGEQVTDASVGDGDPGEIPNRRLNALSNFRWFSAALWTKPGLVRPADPADALLARSTSGAATAGAASTLAAIGPQRIAGHAAHPVDCAIGGEAGQ